MLSQTLIENFSNMVSSLKLAQRAELLHEDLNENLIEILYVDPLPNNGLMKQIVQDNTVFLIGRKGTGKSTIFARVQQYFRNSKSEISAYVDVKTLHGRSLSQEIKIDENEEVRDKYHLYQGFIVSVLSDLIDEVEKSLKQKNIMFRLLKKKDFAELQSRLKSLKIKVMNPEYVDDGVTKQVKRIQKTTKSKERERSANISAQVATTNQKLDSGLSERNKSLGTDEEADEFSKTLVRNFNLTSIISEIIDILKSVGIKKLHVLLDDFSEIEFDVQRVFVNTILAPLNNWSDKFIRFKVAAYPKRIFYGEIDKGKIDEVHLDYYELYKVKDLPELEKKALEFLERLLTTRFEYYLDVDFEEVFQVDRENTWESYLELLFHSSMNIPRVLGHILHYCYQSAIIYGKKISKPLIEQAAQKYYENQVKYYFEKTNFLKEAFEEKLDRYSQEILVNLLVEKSKELKALLASENSELFKSIPKSRIPTSHFFINKEYEKFLHSLELNYFVSKYYEQADRDGIVISIYCINFGLCREQNIIYGRPKGGTKYRKYYISRHFNYDKLIQHYLLEQKQFVCGNCGIEYPYTESDILSRIGMMCYRGCKEVGKVNEVYKFKDQNLLEGVRREKLLPEVELDILHVLSQNTKAKLYASLIARELDCAYQLISRRTTKLQQQDLLSKEDVVIDGSNRKVYHITDKATKLYFPNSEE